jgi:NAD(P)H-nitrite reductase large subunit
MLATVADIGARLKAGTNCGSCVPELKALLQQHDARKLPEERSKLTPVSASDDRIRPVSESVDSLDMVHIIVPY